MSNENENPPVNGDMLHVVVYVLDLPPEDVQRKLVDGDLESYDADERVVELDVPGVIDADRIQWRFVAPVGATAVELRVDATSVWRLGRIEDGSQRRMALGGPGWDAAVFPAPRARSEVLVVGQKRAPA